MRTFLNGRDSELSGEEYFDKHGYNRPEEFVVNGLLSQTGPAYVVKTLPNGETIKIVKEGVSGASRAARKILRNNSKWELRAPSTADYSREIIANMRSSGINVTGDMEREIFTNVARGNKAIYWKYFK